MDLGMGDEVTAVEAINGPHLQSKESEYPLKPSSSEMLELNEMVIPEDHDDHKNSPDFFADVLDASNLDRIGASENACTSPHCIDEAGIMVEELTLRNYSDENLAVVGPSSNRDKMLARQNKWHHLYQIAGGSGNGEDARYAINPEFPDQKPLNNNVAENLPSNLNKPVSSTPLLSHSGIRTKIISKSGFSEYFVKNTLKGKGVVFRGPSCEGLGIELKDQTYPKVASVTKVDPGPLLSTKREAIVPPCHGTPKPLTGLRPDTFHDGVSLREWLNSGQNKGNKVKSLYIFKQIVDMVNNSHSRGVALLELRPSYFKLLMSNEVMYLGSYVKKETLEKSKDQNVIYPENGRNEKRPLEQASFPVVSQWVKKRKPGENTNLVRRWPLFPNRSGVKSAIEPNVNAYGSHFSGNEFNMEYNPTTEYRTLSGSQGLHVRDSSKSVLTSASDPSEVKWYASPEELNEEQCTLESNIYCLGVLLFELLCSFDSGRAHGVAMMDLRHRIFPPSFLAESPKEAGFCLLLLHPAPSLRPTTREILQSEVINGIQDLSANDLSASINHEDDESELLLHFLESLKEQKHKSSSKLIEELKFLEADIQEVERRQTNKSLFPSCLPNESNLMRNINQLTSAYFSVRSNVQCSDDLAERDGKKFLESVENWSNTNKDDEINKPTDRLGVFFNGLCKYARYSKFKVCGILRNGDLSNSANVICSLSFDRDEDYFAAAGVSKKIKIYDFHALFNDSVDIHYPVIEMSNRSKLSSTCWNSYIRNYLASTDYDGVVKLWDAGTGQGISEYAEHSRRAWSVDFSRVDPTKVASGGDDCTVKLWNINEKNSLCTIRNIANVCCVQFSTKSSHLITFGSADYKTYCYDLRNISTPWCVLAGHARAVSYVKFLDSETLVSASTDNTLKLWDLNKTSASGLSTNACSLTLRGHTNEKNFVGLSVADDGYIVCGSETNEVYAYYRSLPMPVTSHKFGSIDPISGKETDDDGGQFVSSVCWRQKSDMVVVANSSGSMKLLQMT